MHQRVSVQTLPTQVSARGEHVAMTAPIKSLCFAQRSPLCDRRQVVSGSGEFSASQHLHPPFTLPDCVSSARRHRGTPALPQIRGAPGCKPLPARSLKSERWLRLARRTLRKLLRTGSFLLLFASLLLSMKKSPPGQSDYFSLRLKTSTTKSSCYRGFTLELLLPH